MPRAKKIKFSSAPEHPEAKKPRRETRLLNPTFLNLKHNRISKNIFSLICMAGSALLLTLIMLTASFFLFRLMIIELKNFKNIRSYGNTINALTQKVSYNTDKNEYKAGENIKLSIVNNSDKSIYLAPCRYFNEFEQKLDEKRRSVILNDCDVPYAPISGYFEKIPRKAEEMIAANDLGKGLWRGVSNIYFDCRQAKAESCAARKAIYSEEFRIEDNPDGNTFNVPERL